MAVERHTIPKERTFKVYDTGKGKILKTYIGSSMQRGQRIQGDFKPCQTKEEFEQLWQQIGQIIMDNHELEELVTGCGKTHITVTNWDINKNIV